MLLPVSLWQASLPLLYHCRAAAATATAGAPLLTHRPFLLTPPPPLLTRTAWEEWKVENKEHHGKLGAKKQQSGLTQEQLIELQQKLFEEARAATLSGPLPSMVVAEAMAAVAAQGAAAAQPAAAQEQEQQQQQQASPEQQQPPAAGGEPAAEAQAPAEAEAAAEGDDDALSDDYSGSSQLV